MNGEDRGRRMKKKGKWMRPSCLLRMNIEESGCAPAAGCHRPQQLPASQLRPPHPVSATCVWPYLAAASIYHNHRSTHYSTAAIAKTPALPGSLALPWSSPPMSLLSPLSGLPRVACRSHLCVICPASSEIHGTSCLVSDDE